MSSPDQQPVDENVKQPADETLVVSGQAELHPQETEQQVSQPLFEYPPPPSFYQNMVIPPEQPAPPLPNALARDAMIYGPQNAGGRGSLPRGQEIPYSGDGYPRPALQPQGTTQTYPPPFVSQPAAKKSKAWVWVVITIISVAVLTSCGLCSWGAYTLFNTAYQQIAGSSDVVNDYYTNLQARNYTAAYQDLAPQGQISGLTQEQFIQQATQRDTQFGPITSFIPGQPNFISDPNTGPDLSRFTMTIDVNRPRLHYTVLLTMSKIGGNWKIIDFDRI